MEAMRQACSGRAWLSLVASVTPPWLTRYLDKRPSCMRMAGTQIIDYTLIPKV